MDWGLRRKLNHTSSESDCSPRTVRFLIPGQPDINRDRRNEEEKSEGEASDRQPTQPSIGAAKNESDKLVLTSSFHGPKAQQRSGQIIHGTEFSLLAIIAIAVALAVVTLRIDNFISERQR